MKRVIRKWWPRLLFALVAAATFFALYYTAENWRWKRAWTNYTEQKKAAGLWPLERFEPIPDNENFAMAPIVFPLTQPITTTNGTTRWLHQEGADRLKTPIYDRRDASLGKPLSGDWTKAEACSLKGFQLYYRGETNFPEGLIPAGYWDGFLDQRKHEQLTELTNRIAFPHPATPGSPANDVLFALSKYDDILGEFSQALKRPQSRFVPGPPDLNTAVFLHMTHLKGICFAYRLRAIAHLEAGHSHAAMQDLRDAYRIAHHIGQDPYIISLLVRAATLDIAHQVVWEGLRTRRWTEAQMAELQNHLSGIDLISQYTNCVATEQFYWLVKSVDSPLAIPPLWSQPGSRYRIPLEWCQHYDEAQRMAVTGASFAQIQSNPILGRQVSAMTHENGVDRGLIRLWRAETHLDLAIIACALERYFHKRGWYPEKLDALVPDYLSAVPTDRIDRRPLRYRRTGDGRFRVYSIGTNLQDNGGETGRARTYGASPPGDWVWRYEPNPASSTIPVRR